MQGHAPTEDPAVLPPTTPARESTRRRRRKGLKRFVPRLSRRTHLAHTGRRIRRRVKRYRRPLLIVFTVLFLGLAADAVYAALQLRASLQAAADHLEAGSVAARESDFATAKAEFGQALEEASSAVSTTNHPSPLIATILPIVGPDARAVRNLSRAGKLSAEAGVQAVEAAESMGASENGLAGSVFSNGRIDFDAVGAGGPFIDRIDGLMAEAADLVRDSPQPSFDPVVTALDQARDHIPSASETAHKANVLFGALPGLFGQEGARRYLLLFQAPSDQRGGGGGLIGLYGLLEADEGRMELVHLGSPYDEGLSPSPLEKSEVPDWFARSYSWASALRDWQSVNISPHFPVVSEALLTMYEKKTGDRLDGVVSMDPVAFAELTKATGPLQGEGMDVTVTPENAVDVLARDVYTTFNNDNNSQNKYLQGVMNDFWTRFSSGQIDAIAAGGAFAEAARTQHFRMYATDEEDLGALDQLGTTGNYTRYDPNVQMVFNENIAYTKVDYFLHRHVATEIRLQENGDAEVTATATLDNRAPEGPPSALIGPGFKSDPIGLNSMYINFLMPNDSQIQSFNIGDRTIRPIRLREEDHLIASEIANIEAGEVGTASITYLVPKAFDAAEEEDARFTFTLWPQATVNPDTFDLAIIPPYGFEVAPGSQVDANGARMDASGTLDEPITFSVSVVPR